MNWFSIVILAIPVAYIFSGLQKGMVRTAFSFLSIILTLVLSFALNPQITKFVQENTPIYDMIQENCQESLMKDTESAISDKTGLRRAESVYPGAASSGKCQRASHREQ